MKKIIYILIFIPTIFNYGWGDEGHRLITKYALKFLPNEINFSEEIKSAIIKHSIDPDYRKKDDASEPIRHFIDIDYYKEFLSGNMITSLDSLKKIYGDSVVTTQGILPWATELTYSNLVSAFKEENKEKIILYAADLAHYVADGHQPLHATLNYNGQLTSQKGVHFRYEIEMINKYLNDIDKELQNFTPVYITNITGSIFNYIYESNFEVDIILNSDKIALKYGDNKYDVDYYRILWFRTKNLTIEKFEQAAFIISSLIYTAWIDAGKPKLRF
ncbi:MAG: hypothetical protein N2249_07460 [Melioribacter sp.]|nr:hypothetical protein [Melioribacter sp.]